MSAPSHPAISYPPTTTVEQFDVYHGTTVADPYRWLEADVRNDTDVAQWVAAQNRVTEHYVDALPQRTDIEKRLRALWDYEKFSAPIKRGNRYFYSYNSGVENQFKVYMRDTLGAEPELLFDPNSWSDDGTRALADYEADPTGRYVAYQIADGGSDWREVRVRDLKTGQDLSDHLQWLKFTALSWHTDGSGFYYGRYPRPEAGQEFQSLNKNSALYFHRIGTKQSEDSLIHSDPEHPDWMFGNTLTHDGRYLVITTAVGTDDRYQVAYLDLTRDDGVRSLITGFDHDYTLVGNIETRLIFRTTHGAPNGRIISIDTAKPVLERVELVAETEHLLERAERIGNRILAQYLADAKSKVELFTLTGKPVASVVLPGVGTAEGFVGSADDPNTFFTFSSFNTPPTTYRFNTERNEVTLHRRSKVTFDSDQFVTKQVFYSSKDGTRVPMFISHHRNIKLDGSNPTLLYGYGGFNISLPAIFSVTRIAWMEMGGIYAQANLRGGGEYGEAWHQAGTKLDKQNVFDDFVAAAQYVVDARYTQPSKLAIMGGSNGGLLVGAVLNQRPELFAAALPAVGVMDMLRFHLFSAGRYWVDDYGSSDDPQEFQALLAYSPYHNLTKQAYPAVMVTTADTDDRVVPGHSFKYAARLQAVQQGDAPVLIRIETRAGHGAGTPTEKVIEQYADQWAFLAEQLGMTPSE